MKQLLVWIFVGLIWAQAAVDIKAHEGGATGYAAITIDGHMLRYQLTLSAIPKGPLSQAMGIDRQDARPDYKLLGDAIAKQLRFTADGAACQAGPRQTTPPNQATANVTAQVDFVCRGAIRKLKIRDDMFDVLGEDIHILAKIDWPGGSKQFAFMPEARETTIVLTPGTATSPTGGASGGVESFFRLGIEHILTGYDHLLFLLALILGGGSLVHMIKIVTAFTVAHSMTLALAAFNIVSVPGYLVEALIALSIAYVAAENLYPKYAISRRWAVAFLFGAVHGLGFSTILREAGLSGNNLVWSLLSFNLGVEFGQAVAVLLAMPVVIWLLGKDWGRWIVTGCSVMLLLAGLGLFAERIISQV